MSYWGFSRGISVWPARRGSLLAFGAALAAFGTQAPGQMLVARRADHILVVQLHLSFLNPEDHVVASLLGLAYTSLYVTAAKKVHAITTLM